MWPGAIQNAQGHKWTHATTPCRPERRPARPPAPARSGRQYLPFGSPESLSETISKAYAGSSPITRASGKKSSITRRRIKNDRLNHAGYLWAFSALRASPGAMARYRHRRDERGDWHASALRNVFDSLIGQLYHCLQHREAFDEAAAFPASVTEVSQAA